MNWWRNIKTYHIVIGAFLFVGIAVGVIIGIFAWGTQYEQRQAKKSAFTQEYKATISDVSREEKEKIISLLKRDYNTLGCPSPKKLPEYLIAFDVSSETSLGSFIPANLVDISDRVPTKYSVICLDKLAAVYLELMLQDAERDNISLLVTSGFRDRGTQEVLYESALERHGNDFNGGVTVAKAEHSEHQLGTTIDVTSSEIDNLSHRWAFSDTDAFDWLQKNAHTYGFVMSYPKDMEHVTGVTFEPWHWRFVGPDVAERVRASGMTLREYLSLSN